ncbi:MAG: orotate phosphoribosyltransferase-like protein [Methanobacteriaceae archaeon]|nr:orotate phosphoribosyltransferase-like protein [Methanobacteriaceae archaeon]
MENELIQKASELRNKGLTTGEIADELNISKDTAQWLTLQMTNKTQKTNKPDDFAINWKTIGSSSTRTRYISEALADLTLEYGKIDAIVGITISGIPFATIMADLLDAELSIFQPIKHMKTEHSTNKTISGTISNNFTDTKKKKIVIVDDVITSGNTIKETIKSYRNQGATPIAVTVLIDKKGLTTIDGVPIKSLIQIKKLG